MAYFLVVIMLFIVLVVFLTMSVGIGNVVGKKRLNTHPEHKLELDGIAESAVFGLLALLIAFSFSGAYDRLEKRKMHMLVEANAFDTAFDFANMLAPTYKKELHTYIKDYLNLHLIAYEQIPYINKVNETLVKSEVLEQKILSTAIKACEDNPNKSLFILIMPAIDQMYRVAQTGILMSEVHPPMIVFIFLVGLAAAGGFLIGYNSAADRQKYQIHAICYVLLTAFTIYLIINIEYPRSGFIRLDFFERVLVNIEKSMIDT